MSLWSSLLHVIIEVNYPIPSFAVKIQQINSWNTIIMHDFCLVLLMSLLCLFCYFQTNFRDWFAIWIFYSELISTWERFFNSLTNIFLSQSGSYINFSWLFLIQSYSILYLRIRTEEYHGLLQILSGKDFQ